MGLPSVIIRHKRLLQVSLIALLCFLIYLPSLGNGFIWDDGPNIWHSKWVGQKDGLRIIWFSQQMYQYYPVTFTIFWLEHKIWGLNTFGYHSVNLILHIFNALLFFYLLLKLYPRLSFIPALLFAVHPIQVETVAWITELKNILSLFFVLCAVLAYLRFERTGKLRDYLLTAVMFICGLLSKTTAVSFVVFPLVYKWWKEGRVAWRQVWLSASFAAISLFSVLYTLYLEYYHVGANSKFFHLDFPQRILLSGRVALFYIYKICLPVKFSFLYPHWPLKPHIWWQWLYPLSVALVLALFLYYRKRIGRGAAALFIFYLASIFPVMGFINVYGMRFTPVADHFAYISTPAILLLACSSLSFLSDKAAQELPLLRASASRALKYGLFLLAITYLCAKTVVLTASYKDEATFWLNLIKENPLAWIAHNNLGLIYQDRGDNKEAVSLYDKAIDANADYAEAYNNRGLVYDREGDSARAILEFTRAIQIDPDYDTAYFNRGVAFSKRGDLDKAISDYSSAIRINPAHGWAYNNRGVIFNKLGDNRRAVEDLTKAIEVDPVLAPAYKNRAVVYFALKDDDKANADMRKAQGLGLK